MSSAGGSFTHVGIQVGTDWHVTCNIYADRTPILDIQAGDLTLYYSIANGDVTTQALAFAQELARKTQAFAAEVERLHAQTGGTGPTAGEAA